MGRLEVISEPARFAAVREPWNRLAGESLFLTWDWLDCWWQAFGARSAMRVYAAWDGPELAAGLAMRGRGRHLASMASAETDLFAPLARSHGDLDEILAPLADGPWSRLTLWPLAAGEPATDRIEEHLRARRWLTIPTVRETCPIVDTSRPFDEYVSTLSANARKQLRRARRALEARGELEVAAVRAVPDARVAVEAGLALEAAGWKGRAGGAALSDPAKARFWRSLFSRFHDLGALRCSELRLDGALIAISLDIVHRRRLYLLKTAYDERFSAFSPGHVLYLEMLRASCDGEIEAHELLGPSHPSKDRYATASRKTLILRAYRRRPVPAFPYGARRLLARPARHLRRRLRQAALRASRG